MLRGLAVLGILVMNIQSFGNPSAEYMNPAAQVMPEGASLAIWSVSHVLADTKFITLFSLLFGVGIAVFAERLTARGRKPAGLHYRRMWWLWVIGMLHGYLLWYGDILVSYAVCGAVVYLLRRLRARWLVLIGTVMIAVPSLGLAGLGAMLPHLPPEALDQDAPGDASPPRPRSWPRRWRPCAAAGWSRCPSAPGKPWACRPSCTCSSWPGDPAGSCCWAWRL